MTKFNYPLPGHLLISLISGNKCSPNPCGDHGTCKATIDYYACECDMAYTGQHCEHIGCTPDTCLNRGSCRQDDNFDLYCNCRSGYRGRRCETGITGSRCVFFLVIVVHVASKQLQSFS